MEYATNAKGNTGVTLGSIGTGLGALNLLGGLGGMMMGRGGGYGIAQHDIDRSDFFNREIQNRDMMIAALNAEKVSNEHDIELYKQFRIDLGNALEPIRQDIKALEHRVHEQDIYNTANTGAVSVLKAQVRELMGLTERKIPNASIMPGWDDAT